MKSYVRVFYLFLNCVVLVGMAQDNVVVRAPGDWKHHLQGVTQDDAGNIYWSFTTALVKSDSAGKKLAAVEVPWHYGDLTYNNGKVYVAVNHGKFNCEPGQADSWVYIHSAADLKLIQRHRVSEAVHGAGGMEWHNGHFYVVGGLPSTYEENYVYEYDSNFNFLKRHVISSGQTRKGIQTVTRGRDGTWWFGCYGKTLILRTDDQFKLMGKHSFNASVGIMQSLSDDNVFLLARHILNKETKLNTAFIISITQAEMLTHSD